MFSKLSGRGIKRKFPEHGIDRPMPKKKGNEAIHFEETVHVQDRPFIEPGSKLAAKFPRPVKNRAWIGPQSVAGKSNCEFRP